MHVERIRQRQVEAQKSPLTLEVIFECENPRVDHAPIHSKANPPDPEHAEAATPC